MFNLGLTLGDIAELFQNPPFFLDVTPRLEVFVRIPSVKAQLY